MKELFPYHGEKILVTKEMCDHNGHMNTGSYTRCFDGCWGQMYTDCLLYTSDAADEP